MVPRKDACSLIGWLASGILRTSLAAVALSGTVAWGRTCPRPVSDENVWWAGTNYWTRYHADSLRRIKEGLREYDCVFLGDSITHNWVGWSDPADVEAVVRAHDGGRGPLKFPNGPGRAVWREMAQRHRLLNLAVGGDRTENLLWRMEHGALDGYRSRLFALMIGTNDVTDNPGEIVDGIRTCLDAIRAKHPEAKVLLHALLPRDERPGTRLRMRNERVNRQIRQLADGRDVFWVDLAPLFLDGDGRLSARDMPDFLHPLEGGYRKWWRAIEPFFEVLVPTRFAKARSVWPQGCGTVMNESFVFASKFRGEGRGTFRIAAVSAYKAKLDGRMLAAGPARAPAGFARIDEYPVSLAPGEHQLEIEVNSYRCNNFVYPNQAPFACAEVVADGRVLVATGAEGDFRARRSARVVRTPRMSFQRGFSEAWQFGRDDADLVPLEETDPVVFLPRLAPPCSFPERADLLPLGNVGLVRDDTLPPLADRALVAIRPPVFCGYRTNEYEVSVWDELYRWRKVAVGESPKASGVLYGGGKNLTGFLRVEVECTEPGRFLAAFDELETGGDVNPLRIEMASGAVWDLDRPGRYVLETFEPQTFRYVRLGQVSGKATWKTPTRILMYNPDLFRRPYSGNDAELSAIYTAGAESLAQNVIDVFMDCPSREHAGWLGDSYFSAPAAQKLAGHAKTERAFLQNFALGVCPDIPKGMIPMCWPSDHTDGVFIPTYALWFVLEVEDYVRRTGDRATGELLRVRVTDLIDYLRTFRNADGLLERLPSWVFVGWDRSNDLGQDVNYPANLLYAGALDAVSRLTGDRRYADEAALVRRTVRRQSLRDGLFRDHAKRGPDGRLRVLDDATETCQYYAFFFGAATVTEDRGMWRRLAEEYGPNWSGRLPAKDAVGLFPGELMRLKLLRANGETSRARAEIKSFFGKMAAVTGTLWEHATTRASCNHAFGAAMLMEIDDGPSGKGEGK